MEPFEIIKKRRKDLGIAQWELGEMTHYSQQSIQKIEKGERQIERSKLKLFAQALQWPIEELLKIFDIAELQTLELTTIPKIGFVEAGLWQEACQWPENEWEYIGFSIPYKWKNKRIFALNVNGDSMNKIFPPNRTTLICCSVEDLGKPIKNGDYVIAYRKSIDGLCESTVKRFYKMSDKEYILRPESDNDKYFDITVKEDGNEYEIGAVVIDYSTRLFDL